MNFLSSGSKQASLGLVYPSSPGVSLFFVLEWVIEPRACAFCNSVGQHSVIELHTAPYPTAPPDLLMPNSFLPFSSPLQNDLARRLPLDSPKHMSYLLKLGLPGTSASCCHPLPPLAFAHVFLASEITHFSVSTLGVAF